MKVTWNWLAEFVELEQSLAEVAERLTMGGIEVEGIERPTSELNAVLCARVESVSPHPQAERLQICEVRAGAGDAVRVVCGAPNVQAGMIVPYAPPGTTLPGGKQIAAAEIRGVHSAGMLCSALELGIGEDQSGLLMLPNDTPVGSSIAEVMGLDDAVIEVSITPNRGDCLSVLGLAREIAALTGQKLRSTAVELAQTGDNPSLPFEIAIADPEGCGRYVGRLIRGVKIGPSPIRMQQRLRAIGMRPINNIVDITNYVMIERGQPLHAFDYDRLPAKEISVRRARPRERMTTLDGQDRELESSDLLITSGGVPVAIAGVMGGENTEVNDATTNILLESAWFQPSSVRQTSKRLGLRSEASYRFERATDIEGVPLAADRALQLMAEIGGGEIVAGRRDVYPGARRPLCLPLRLKRLDDLLGTCSNPSLVSKHLSAFGMTVADGASGTLNVTVPSYRSDIAREIDLIEEVARAIGYENLPATTPICALAGAGDAPQRVKQRRLAALLNGLGLDEVVMASFCSPQDNQAFTGLQREVATVTVINPMSQEESQLRRSLCAGLVNVVRHNLAQGINEFAGFTIGKVFWPLGDAFEEGLRVAGIISGAFPALGTGSRGRKVDFADWKGVVEAILAGFRLEAQWRAAADVAGFHPGQTARVAHGGKPLGVVGRLHPRLAEECGIDPVCWVFELDLEILLDYEPPPVTFEELPRFPAVVRDLAIVVDNQFESQEVIRFIQGFGGAGELIERVQLFDAYSGDPIPAGKRSLAYSIAYRASDRTLTDNEVNEVHQRLIAALGESLAIELR